MVSLKRKEPNTVAYPAKPLWNARITGGMISPHLATSHAKCTRVHQSLPVWPIRG